MFCLYHTNKLSQMFIQNKQYRKSKTTLSVYPLKNKTTAQYLFITQTYTNIFKQENYMENIWFTFVVWCKTLGSYSSFGGY